MIEKNWKKTLLDTNATIQDAILNLCKSSRQISLVVSSNKTLIGTITDGDIRRGILRGLDMNSPVTTIVKREPLVVTPNINRNAVLQLMNLNALNAIPIVNKSRHVVGLYLLNELIQISERPNLMIIMVGGQGIRMRPHTENCPKPLLLVNGKPMLEHIILRAKDDGFHNFVFAIHYLGHMIKEYFGDGSQWQVNIEYLSEDKPLGTAGAISLLEKKPNEAIVVTNGDVITDINYGELLDFHLHHKKTMATMAVRLHELKHPYGVVHTRGVDIIALEEKPVVRNQINAGIYALDPQALNLLKKDQHCDMPTLFHRLNEMSMRTIVYPIHEPWLDVGRAEDYSIANGNT